jgi:preprotein translocase subunit SecA
MLMKKEELENLELTQKQFTSSIERAQKQIEARHFSIRKHLFDYDSVIDKQRQRIYRKRDDIIASELDEDLKKEFVKYTKKDLRDNIDLIVNVKINEAKNLKQTNIEFLEALIKEFNIKLDKKTANKRENM